ncbi:hypothetical protein PRIEUP_LOCUS1976, partial [Pristimantis euphronides]
MEEWEYMEENRGLYKDAMMEENRDLYKDAMMEGQCSVISPERCPRPLYSQDCPEDNVPENQQGENLMDIKDEVKDEAEETDIRTDQSRRRSPPERCPHPLYSQDWPEED